MITVELPDPGTDAFLGLAYRLAQGTHVAGDDVVKVLAALVGMGTGPRYVAVHSPTDPDPDRYLVVDRRTGETKGAYTGCFAGQDARSYARILNGHYDD